MVVDILTVVLHVYQTCVWTALLLIKASGGCWRLSGRQASRLQDTHILLTAAGIVRWMPSAHLHFLEVAGQAAEVGPVDVLIAGQGPAATTRAKPLLASAVHATAAVAVGTAAAVSWPLIVPSALWAAATATTVPANVSAAVSTALRPSEAAILGLSATVAARASLRPATVAAGTISGVEVGPLVEAAAASGTACQTKGRTIIKTKTSLNNLRKPAGQCSCGAPAAALPASRQQTDLEEMSCVLPGAISKPAIWRYFVERASLVANGSVHPCRFWQKWNTPKGQMKTHAGTIPDPQ